jgi:hypothetical protein
MSIIAAGTTTTTALSSTGNTDGTLQLQVNGTTPSVTLNTLGAVGVGSTPAFGTSGQVLTSAGSTAAPSWSTNVSSQWVTTGSDIYYNTGNVGIGNTAPTAKLQLGWSLDQLKFTNPTAGTKRIGASYTGYLSGNDHAAIDLSGAGSSGGQIAFNVTPNGGSLTTAATLNLDGKLLVGSTSAPSSVGVQLLLNSSSSSGGLQLNYGAGTGGGAIVGAAGAGINFYTYTGAIGSESYSQRFNIGSAGQLGIGASPSYGTSGQVLTSGGSGAAPSWATPAGGSWVYLSTVTASNAATADVETTFDSTYDMYAIVGVGIYGTTANNIYIRLKIGGSYQAGTSYRYGAAGISSTSITLSGVRDNATDAIRTANTDLLSAASDTTANIIAYIPNPSSTTTYKSIFGQAFGGNGGNDAQWAQFVGFARGAATSALTGVRFFNATGNIYGTFRLYGIKNS